MPIIDQPIGLCDLASEAIAQLNRSERGRRVLRAVADASLDISGLDRENTEALVQLLEVFGTHQVNGSVLDLLRPHRSPRV